MSKLSGESLNITEQNLAKLQQLFPEAFTEGKIDFDMLKQLLGDFVDDDEERYRFKWNGKGRALRLSQTPSLGTLRPCKEESKDWDNTQNLYIEGDNLEVLKLLQKSYYGKVKLIYIDPPYNTGKDFVYKDDFRDNIENYKKVTGQVDDEGHPVSPNTESNGRFHTDWLNMIYPRLRLARNLLSEDGIIFISIDDNEQSNLKKICDEVFGFANSLTPFIWPLPRGINAGIIARAHEYILCYGKNINSIVNFNRLTNEIEYSIERCNKKIDDRHPESTIDFPAGVPYEGVDKTITGTITGSEQVKIIGELVFKDGKLVKPVTLSAGWTMKNMILDWLKGKKVYDLKGQEIVGFFFKENGKLYSKKQMSTYSIKSILNDIPDTQVARKEMESLFGSQDIFPYPKTIELPKLFAKLSTSTNDIILDFFSGSATTAHAVMQLNAEDGGHRKFIMVQIPEPCPKDKEAYKAGYKTIAEIGKERIRRAGEKILSEMAQKSQPEEGLLIERERERERELAHSARGLDVGFKVFKLDSSNLRKWNPQPEDLQIALQESVENFLPGRKELDVVYEILLKKGYEITVPIAERDAAGKQVYVIGDGSLMVCLGNNITVAVADEIVKLHREYGTKDWSVVFQDNGFASDMDKTNIKETLKTAGLDESCFECL